MSTFFGASARNRELKWIVTIDDSKAKSGLNDLKRGFTDLDTTTKTTTRNLGTMTQQQFQAIDRSAQGAGKQIEGFGTKLKSLIGNFSTFGIGISTTIGSTVQLGRAYRDLTDTQIAVDRTALKMSRTQEALTKAQAKLNDLQSKGIKGGAEYEQALTDVQQAQDASTLAIQIHDEALERQGDTYMNFAQSIVPTVIGAVSTTGAAFKELGLNTNKVKGIIPAFSSGFLTLAGAEDTAAVSARGLATALGTLAAPILAAKAAFDIIPKTEEFKKNDKIMKDATKTIRQNLLAEKANIEHELQNFDLTNLDTWATSATKLLNGISDEDLRFRLNAINKLLAESDKGLVDLDVTVTSSVAKEKDWKLGLAGVHQELGDGTQKWFPPYIMKMKQWRDEILKSGNATKQVFGGNQGQIEFFQLWNKQWGNATTAVHSWTDSTLSDLAKVDDELATEAQSFNNKFKDFARNSRLELFTAFDIKTPEERADKFIQKFVDKLPNKYKKKIDLILDPEGKNAGFKEAATSIISGLADEIEKDDKLADSVVKTLSNMTPNTPEGKKFKAWLNSLIKGSDTGAALVHALETDTNGTTIRIPAELKFGGSVGSNTSNEIEQNNGLVSSYVLKQAGITKPVEIPAVLKVAMPPAGGGAFPWTSKPGGSGNLMKISLGGNGKSGSNNSAEIEGNDKFIGVTSAGFKALGQKGKGKGNAGPSVTLSVNTAGAIKAIDVVANRISTLSTIPAAVSLQNKDAVRVVDVVANRISTLNTIVPEIQVNTKNAIKAVDVVAKRIEGLENINPVVHVTFTGSGKISGAASGSIRVAQHGMHEILGEDTMIYAHAGEAVHIDRASGGYNASSRGSNGSGSGQPIVVENHIHMMDREIVRSFKSELGKGRSKFGL